jgi:uncharacterized membrane protein
MPHHFCTEKFDEHVRWLRDIAELCIVLTAMVKAMIIKIIIMIHLKTRLIFVNLGQGLYYEWYGWVPYPTFKIKLRRWTMSKK